MSTATVSLFEIAAEWRTARRLYPFYSGLIREFQLDISHCKDLESLVDRAEREVLGRIQSWFGDVDRQVQVAQMRQLLQTQRFNEEELLRGLLLRHLPQEPRDENLRDKLDYLLVQYFATVAPHHPHDVDVTSSEVREVLRPVLGHVELRKFAWAKELDDTAEAVNRCSSLSELLDSGLVELGRKAKGNLKGEYFEPAALIEITRFNFRLRLGFFRLMHADLHAIRKAVQELEAMGVSTVDCREAALGSEEPLATLRTLCHQWKKPFREAYRGGQSFRQLGIIRNILVNTSTANGTQRPKSGESNNGTALMNAAVGPAALPELTATGLEGKQEHPDTLEDMTETISEQLFASKEKTKVSTIVLAHSKQILASWEVNAFVRGGEASCAAIQRAVAARCLLAEAVEKYKQGHKNAVVQPLRQAHVQAALIQEQVAKAKDLGDIDSAVSLAATAKRLLSMIDETEKLKA